jgi:hypothetical protein
MSWLQRFQPLDTIKVDGTTRAPAQLICEKPGKQAEQPHQMADYVPVGK